VVISVRNCIVGLGVDTLYCARFLTGGAFDPYVVPPCISPSREEHQNRDSTRTARRGFLSVLTGPQGLAKSENHVHYWCSSVTLWL